MALMEKVASSVNVLSEFPLVQAGDCDFLQKLTLTALQRRMQETAWTHAARLGLDADSLCGGHFHWVLGRLSLFIHGPLPRWKDSYEVRTWISGHDRLFAFREFEFRQGGRPFGTAATTWLLIDAQSRKPVSPEEAFACKDLDYPAQESTLKAKRLRAEEGGTPSNPCRVGYRDVDLHNHVNNTRYLAYFLDTLSREHYQVMEPREFHLNFLQEITWGDEILTYVSTKDSGTFLHRIEKAGGRVCALGESRWELCTNP